ncbi:MAG TPA: winged helix DNA-binding domain-containing protein [Pyrinomonadaceae bacterium]|nr:winged helix DNA-binding domain-containing protein [Pyrinomonadaceae bacterium]
MRWLGAVQAQDFNAAKWAVALRMRDATHAAIEEAFNAGHIIRTHLLRPTWHFVAPEDVRWLLQLTAPQVNRRCGPNYRKYELDDAVFKRSNKVLTGALRGGKHLTRAILKTALNKAGVAADDTVRLAHLLLRAELDGVVCSGPRTGKQFTYALLEERVPQAKTPTREEALAELTSRYFSSHGPATLQDFVWWSGLTAADARRGIEMYGETRITRISNPIKNPCHLLPAFDEYFVAYKDRPAGPGVTNWDLLGPTVIINGKVVGTWKRDATTVNLNILRPVNKSEQRAIDKAVKRYLEWLKT